MKTPITLLILLISLTLTLPFAVITCLQNGIDRKLSVEPRDTISNLSPGEYALKRRGK